MEHLDAPILDCARTNSPATRELMASGKGPTLKQINEAIQSALEDCDPAKMTPVQTAGEERHVAGAYTRAIPFYRVAHPEQDPRLRYVIRPIRDECAAMLPDFHNDLWHRVFLLKLRFVRAMHAQGVRFLTGTDKTRRRTQGQSLPSLCMTSCSCSCGPDLRPMKRCGLRPGCG